MTQDFYNLTKSIWAAFVTLLAVYGAVMGFVNYQIHKALKDYLEEKGLGE